MKVGEVYYYDNSSVHQNSIKSYKRIISFDSFEVFSEGKQTQMEDWNLNDLGRSRRFSFPRTSRMNFEQFTKYLGLEPFNADVEKMLHSHLLLRIGRMRNITWGDEVFETKHTLDTYLENGVDEKIRDKRLMVSSIYLEGTNLRGYPTKPELIHADNGDYFTVSELLFAANKIQMSIKLNKNFKTNGIGIYRSGEIKNGLPVYYAWGYYDLAGFLKKYEDEGVDISMA